jgi:murein DD-endopeptidase MepM/ murein hydrolase activator NlpD
LLEAKAWLLPIVFLAPPLSPAAAEDGAVVGAVVRVEQRATASYLKRVSSTKPDGEEIRSGVILRRNDRLEAFGLIAVLNLCGDRDSWDARDAKQTRLLDEQCPPLRGPPDHADTIGAVLASLVAEGDAIAVGIVLPGLAVGVSPAERLTAGLAAPSGFPAQPAVPGAGAETAAIAGVMTGVPATSTDVAATDMGAASASTDVAATDLVTSTDAPASNVGAATTSTDVAASDVGAATASTDVAATALTSASTDVAAAELSAAAISTGVAETERALGAAPSSLRAPEFAQETGQDQTALWSLTTVHASFRWPARGTLLSSFQSSTTAGPNTGIDLAVPEGTEVAAAADGIVIFAGEGPSGLSKLVLLSHSGNWFSAYADLADTKVEEGESVARGQVIALSGRADADAAPRLHFELRRGLRPVDPLPRLADE